MAEQDLFDVVIVGSGAGGAPVAHTLVGGGKSVLILEKGPLFRPQRDDPFGLSDYKRDELISDGPRKSSRPGSPTPVRRSIRAMSSRISTTSRTSTAATTAPITRRSRVTPASASAAAPSITAACRFVTARAI